MSDDELTERLLALLRCIRTAHEEQVLADLASCPDNQQPTAPAEAPPMPLEWHPWFRGKAYLVDWLHDKAHPFGRNIRLPVPRPPRFCGIDEDVKPAELALNCVTLTKREAYGNAPYVGEPFVYVWPVATDEYGRSIAGEARIQHLGWRP